jgi:hypothetical protein
MLRRTFVHLKGIGAATERGLWSAGILSWEDFVAAAEDGRLGPVRSTTHLPGVQESIRRAAAGDLRWFDAALATADKWRAYGELHDRAAFVDIETNGLGFDGESITVIGVYDGRVVRQFVEGRDLEAAQEHLESFPLVVSYNGAAFDLPVIRRKFPYNLFNHVHVDALYPARRLGWRGGLKKVEELLGLVRAPEIRGLGGWDAVRLWREHQYGSAEALDLLLAYNAADVRNLKPLMDEAYRRLWAIATGIPARGGPM